MIKNSKDIKKDIKLVSPPVPTNHFHQCPEGLVYPQIKPQTPASLTHTVCFCLYILFLFFPALGLEPRVCAC